MIDDYLNSNMELLTEKLHILDTERKELQNNLDENKQFIQMLDKDTYISLQAFSPREVNSKNQVKIKQLEQEQKDLKEKINLKQKEIDEIEQRIEELAQVISSYKREKEERTHRSQSTFSEREDLCEKELSMSLRILEAQENERKRIAMELHDDSVQQLTSIVHKADLCTKLIQLDPVRCKMEIMTMSNSIRNIIEDMRKMIYDLRPMTFDDIGFDVTVERALDKMRRETTADISFQCDKDINKTDKVILITLLRIIMEACNNAIKYANSDHIEISLYEQNNLIRLQVYDDGLGFDIEEVYNKKNNDNTGFGLKIMKERVALLAGTIEIQSKINSGTKINVSVPTCKEEEI